MTTHQHRHGESSARPERDNALGAGQGAEGAKQKSGQADYSAMLEVLNRIAEALESQKNATWAVAERLEDLQRYMGGGL